MAPFAALLLLLVLGALVNPNFISLANLENVATRSAFIAIIAVGATFVVLATVNATLYAIFAGSAAALLASRRAQRAFNVAGGSLLSLAGVWALLARRTA